MKYWDDMASKYGFSDGDAEPTEARHCRTAYVLAVNALAKQLGSKHRAVAYNRPSTMHNSCMILFVSATDVDETVLMEGEPCEKPPSALTNIDSAFREAIRQADELRVTPDDCIATESHFIDDAANEMLEEIEADYGNTRRKWQGDAN
jgi:hypothetical protein